MSLAGHFLVHLHHRLSSNRIHRAVPCACTRFGLLNTPMPHSARNRCGAGQRARERPGSSLVTRPPLPRPLTPRLSSNRIRRAVLCTHTGFAGRPANPTTRAESLRCETMHARPTGLESCRSPVTSLSTHTVAPPPTSYTEPSHARALHLQPRPANPTTCAEPLPCEAARATHRAPALSLSRLLHLHSHRRLSSNLILRAFPCAPIRFGAPTRQSHDVRGITAWDRRYLRRRCLRTREEERRSVEKLAAALVSLVQRNNSSSRTRARSGLSRVVARPSPSPHPPTPPPPLLLPPMSSRFTRACSLCNPDPPTP